MKKSTGLGFRLRKGVGGWSNCAAASPTKFEMSRGDVLGARNARSCIIDCIRWSCRELLSSSAECSAICCGYILDE